jgi:hypothetical protein
MAATRGAFMQSTEPRPMSLLRDGPPDDIKHLHAFETHTEVSGRYPVFFFPWGSRGLASGRETAEIRTYTILWADGAELVESRFAL